MTARKIILKGIPASPGKVSGKIGGDILVVDFLTPAVVSLLKENPSISGIITDRGGATCHAAIIARELKIPYISGASGATRKLKNNMEVTMDAGQGIVYGSA